MTKPKPKRRKPRCKCGRICRYYGPIGGFSVQCEKCNADAAVGQRMRRARAKTKRAKPPKKWKPRRVVLGTGWLYADLSSPRWISLRREDPKELDRTYGPGPTQVQLRVKGTNLRKIRLVAEVLD